MNVEIFNETNEEIKDLKKVEEVVEYALKKENLEDAIFNIIFVNNEYIRELNKNYRNIDRPTDVITFALEDEKEMIVEEVRVLGDIYISIDKAKEQSIEYNHSLTREISFLVVHGFYHLLGYDHITKEEEEIMFKKQDEILEELNIGRNEV